MGWIPRYEIDDQPLTGPNRIVSDEDFEPSSEPEKLEELDQRYEGRDERDAGGSNG